MKAIVAALLLLACLSCSAQTDGGGRDVRVALFSAQPPRRVAVSAAGPGAWWAPCVTCAHQPFRTTLFMPAVKEIIAGGPVNARDEEGDQSRSANGLWHLRANSSGNIDTVLTLPSERYVAAVLMGETLPGDPPEYLRAMAVIARTYVLRLPPAGGGGRNTLASDVCDSTACQAMRLGPVSAGVTDAVRSTAGETLWFGAARAEVFFSASCGGVTESASAVWPRLANLPYLRSIADPWCVRKDHAAWHGEVPLASLQAVARSEGWRLPARINSAEVAARTSSQRARSIAFGGADGRLAAVAASSLRLAIGRALGWNIVRSDAYDVKLRDGTLVFDGRGHGHGVGLCQQGAAEMARAGKAYRDVLAFYFPGTSVRITRSDAGWQRSTLDGIALAGTAITQAQRTAAADAWRSAQQRFPVNKAIAPAVTFAPTTEVFRQLTSQPGWQLASTSGAEVVLQPPAAFTANHALMQTTLQHEMLHVAVESSASPNAPLWLREGLVEVLAGDAPHATPSLSADDTDRLLKSASSRAQSQAAHDAAAARTRLLIERYGMLSVRNWLVTGSSIPTG